MSFTPLLASIHRSIERSYENVDHIDAQALAELPEEDIVIFDVRESTEYMVSHMRNAAQINPGISRADFQTQYGDAIEGKRVVFYCSVGRRSSMLAERVSELVVAKTHTRPINLKGGLFNWSNENRVMVADDETRTDAIHPYNWFWGWLIDNREAIRYGRTN